MNISKNDKLREVLEKIALFDKRKKEEGFSGTVVFVISIRYNQGGIRNIDAKAEADL